MILTITHPAIKPEIVEKIRPMMTLLHSSQFTASKLPWSAKAAPVSPAIRACDSEVGMPSAHAPTAQVTMPTQPAASAINAW